MIRRHPVVGERILSAAPALEPVARLVRSSYDAMTSARPYREALPAATAFDELCRCAGRQFDPIVVAAFYAEMNQLDPEAAVSMA
jgi:response regulator RpfG family c-di-GMP phosphodiesterase